MIHAVYKEKADILRNEDVKTSSIIGTLVLLPGELFWKLIRGKASDAGMLPKSSGDIVKVEFWPHWYVDGKDKEVTNEKLVEPDVFIEFEGFNLIIEVKQDGNPQYEQQWINQVCSYKSNVDSGKPLFYIALGGNQSLDSSVLAMGRAKGQRIHKCSWQGLLENVHNEIAYLESDPFMHDRQNMRILRMAELSFSMYGERITIWLESIPVELADLSDNCVYRFKEIWKS